MNIITQNIAKSLNPNLIAHRPKAEEVAFFERELNSLWKKINRNEREEFVKGEMKNFLQTVVFTDKNHHINVKNNIDLVVRENDGSPIQIIFEVKRELNKSEMITQKDFNKKAFHELVYYFMEERIGEGNINLTYLIITTVKEWYIFDAKVFEALFNKTDFVKEYKKFKEGRYLSTSTDCFYNDIAKPYINSLTEEITATYFNLADYVEEGAAQKSDVNQKIDIPQDKIINLYKILSPDFLLKRTINNDANELNQQFYEELLHIMGLEEVKDSGKHIIQRKASQRNPASLIEMTLAELETVGIEDVADKDFYGETMEEQYFAIALDLCTTWVNRILFLKLLEGQMMNYHDNNPKYRFLNTAMLGSFSELYRLFHNVLAKKIEERGQYKEKYAFVPYLNSSLFDLTTLEGKVKVTAMDDNFLLPLHKSSVLRQNKTANSRSEIQTLPYLLAFLDAYDFASDGSGSLMQDDNKALINASVLGKVFEKINGYKDGSIYTPSFITMYMASQSVRRAILHKFEEAEWLKVDKNATLKTAYTDLSNRLNGISITDRRQANDLINSLKICDPAVGSGHLLVSVLNEIIAIKSELRLLVDEDGKELRYNVRVVNDELLVYNDDNDTEYFKYKPKSSSSLRVQKTLFEEKRKIIEGCLFGVDLNPNSVKICRLRLWIELLKNAYYQGSGDDLGELETLPNIDINIKNGNAILHRFKIDADLSKALKKSKYTFATYRQMLQNYREARTAKDKQEFLRIVDIIKADLRTEVSMNHKYRVALRSAENGILALLQQQTIFPSEKEQKEQQKKQADFEKTVVKMTAEISHIENNPLYKTAFEWRFEFPEVLNDEGDFVGFDIIIGNPPYIQLQKNRPQSELLKTLDYETYTATGDVYCLFYELALRLLRPKAILAYITSNKWMRAAYGESLRNFFVQKANPLLLIDFGGTKVFDNATVDVNILLATKEPYQGLTLSSLFAGTKKELQEMHFFPTTPRPTSFLPNTSWVILSPIEQSIKQKIEAIGTPLKDWDINIYRGVLTGFNEAFIIDKETKDNLIKEDPKSAEVLRPILRGRDIKKYTAEFADKWVILAKFGSHKYLENDYPAIYNHLFKYKAQLEIRGQCRYGGKNNAGMHHWLELDNCPSQNYLNDFDKLKIVYPNMTKYLPFMYDEYDNYFVNDKGFIITGLYLKYLLAFLNSKLFKVCFKDLFPELLGGTRELRKIFFDKIPILIPTKEQDIIFTKLVNIVIDLKQKKQDTTDIENQIDLLFYNLFQLTEVEITIMNNAIVPIDTNSSFIDYE
jgi:type II restriction/modification system DNA methylase subunit YeeA